MWDKHYLILEVQSIDKNPIDHSENVYGNVRNEKGGKFQSHHE